MPSNMIEPNAQYFAITFVPIAPSSRSIILIRLLGIRSNNIRQARTGQPLCCMRRIASVRFHWATTAYRT